MADAEDLLEELLEKQLEHVRARKGSEREAQLEARIDKLEQMLAGKPAAEVEEAAEELELDDEELAWVKEALAERRAANPKPVIEETPVEEEQPKIKTRPGRKNGRAYKYTVEDGKVIPSDMVHIYSGPDEDDEVPIPDEEPEADAA